LHFTQRGILAYTLGTAARLQGKYGEPAEAVLSLLGQSPRRYHSSGNSCNLQVTSQRWQMHAQLA